MSKMAGFVLHDNIESSSLDINPAARSHFFQPPPQTPSASSSLYLHNFNPYDQRVDDSCRKRNRDGSIVLGQITPYSAGASGWSNIQSNRSRDCTPGARSPGPFVNTRYRLAGGLDTPTAALSTAFEQREFVDATPDADFRRGGDWSTSDISATESYFTQLPSALARERNGHSRGQVLQLPDSHWGTTVLTTFGGIAGKVWQFCTAGAFGGFYAGGGKGYAMNTSEAHNGPKLAQESTWQDINDSKSNPFTPAKNISLTTIPGGFPASDYIPDYMSDPSRSSPERDTKRPRIDHSISSNGPGGGWTMVGLSNNSPSPAPPASRPSFRKTASNASTPSTRRTTISRPHLIRRSMIPNSPTPHGPQPASSASLRSPVTTPSRPTHRHTHSYNGSSRDSTPLSAAATAKILKHNKEKDRMLSRMDAQMTAMIKEAREALGTTVEIEIEELVDEGLVSGGREEWPRRGRGRR